MKIVYADNNATTKVDPEVVEMLGQRSVEHRFVYQTEAERHGGNRSGSKQGERPLDRSNLGSNGKEG